jgi:hypothetical protein
VTDSCDIVGQESSKGTSLLTLSSSAKMQAITDKMLFKLPEFMASSNGRKSDAHRPRPLQASKSWSRIEPESPSRSTRSTRASIVQNGAVPEVSSNKAIRKDKMSKAKSDVFEKGADEDVRGAVDEATGKLPADFDELPIELVSLTDRSVGLDPLYR